MPAPDNQNPTAWDLVLGALRRGGVSTAASAEASPAPYGFATRVAAQYSALRREAKARLWARLSLQGALASAAIFLVACLVAVGTPGTESDSAPVLLVAPPIDLPSVR
ncbi:hypothetical protein BH23VER1_BH23VER1_02330 [soil metagenome]